MAYSPASSTRKSWQRATKFREHLSFISSSSSTKAALKSAFSPITPNDDEQRLYRPTSPPPPLPSIPIMPLVQFPTTAAIASHPRPTEQEPDNDRTFSVERARAEAAEALERNSKERREARDRLDREREIEKHRQEILERERAHQASRAKQAEAGFDDGDDERDDDSQFDDVDMEKGSRAGPSNGRSVNPTKSFSSKLLRLSRAMFKMPTTPAPETPSPFPRDGRDEHDETQRRPSATSWFATIPARASILSPWQPLNVQKNSHSRTDSEMGGSVIHHHWYGNGGSASQNDAPTPRPLSYTIDDAHREGKHKGKGNRVDHCYGCKVELSKAKSRKSKMWCIGLGILLLLIIGTVIFVNLVIVKKTPQSSSTSSGSTSTLTTTISAGATNVPTSSLRSGTATVTSTSTAASATSTTAVSPALQACLTQFSSTTNPSAYDCTTCIPLLAAVPNDFSSSLSSAAPIQGVGNVLQFCALQSINAALPSGNASVLTKVGWMADTRMCSWAGVACDQQGRVNNLQLVAPGVPQALPSELQYLVGLTTLSIVGANQAPTGAIDPLLTLHGLTSLTLQQTALTASFTSNELSTAFPGLTALSMNKNTGITISGSTLAGITQLSALTGLVMNFQTIPINALDIITNTGNSNQTPLQSSLTTLDLSSTNIGGTLSSGLAQGLPNLVELHLDNNAFTALPANDAGVVFPPKVTSVSIRGNTAMSGTISTAECDALGKVSATTCDFTGTAVMLATGVAVTEGGCSVCIFGSASK
ncbi:hypothetical protein FRB95_001757 [Tulasnella sp. JGI-2019a]|nr:hypothetical protein FRB93_010461 [Tulasnella sp. JGI-2019a]KAG9038345.1 hypothetical protein FRB95_001757 [Tulasnella sp. JGI-2019a]